MNDDVASLKEAVPPEALREDLDFLLSAIEEGHPDPYAHVSRAELAGAFRSTSSAIAAPMSPADFYRLLAPLVASLRNAHTHVSRPACFDAHVAGGGAVFPLALEYDGVQPVVVESFGPEPLPAGAAVLAIDGLDATAIIDRFARYLPREGLPSNPWMIAREDWLWWWLWLEFGSQGQLELRLETPDGTISDHSVSAVPQSGFRGGPPRRPDYGYRPIPEWGAGLIECRLFRDCAELGPFLKAAFADITSRNLAGLILDLRRCRGGLSTGADALLGYLTDRPYRQFQEIRTRVSEESRAVSRELPPGTATGDVMVTECPFLCPPATQRRFTGQVCVLIAPTTFSTGVSVAWTAKRTAAAVLIGQEAGDRTACAGGSCPVSLPHSRLQVNVATQYVVCDGASAQGQALRPDYEVRQLREDTARGVDTVIRFALELLRRP
jgi:hypothetical protein